MIKFAFIVLILLCAPMQLAAGEQQKIDSKQYHEKALAAHEVQKKHTVSVDRFIELSKQEGAVILDVRSKAAFDRGHLDGALHLGAAITTEEKMRSLLPSKDSKLLIYCDNSLSAELTRRMSLTDMMFPLIYQFGYENLYQLQDGKISGEAELAKLSILASSQETDK
jgi:phage shock protein E